MKEELFLQLPYSPGLSFAFLAVYLLVYLKICYVMLCMRVCVSYICKPIGTRAVPQLNTGVILFEWFIVLVPLGPT